MLKIIYYTHLSMIKTSFIILSLELYEILDESFNLGKATLENYYC
jgi:hypothetical protein